MSDVGVAINACNASDASNVSGSSAPSDASVAGGNNDASNVSGTASDAWVMRRVDDACRQNLFPFVSVHNLKLIFKTEGYFILSPLHWVGLSFWGTCLKFSRCEI